MWEKRVKKVNANQGIGEKNKSFQEKNNFMTKMTKHHFPNKQKSVLCERPDLMKNMSNERGGRDKFSDIN